MGGKFKSSDLLIRGIARAVTAERRDDDQLGIVTNAAVVIRNGLVSWIGRESDLPAGAATKMNIIDAGGRMVTPGLIDCHAHPIFAGTRDDEFARRAAGQEYREIAAAGGGINATLVPTRRASFAELVRLTKARLDRALEYGTTTCEAKSGYDLTVDGELRLLEVAKAVNAVHAVELSPTLLGAHLVPPERRNQRELYVADVVDKMIPKAARRGLATAVDVYCDDGAFTVKETRRILTAARDAGLGVRGHVGQFADLGGPELLAELGAWSADHLEEISDHGIAALARADVVAVMLPSACVQLRQTPPPVGKLRRAGVKMAVATDMNPGSSTCEILSIPMWLATTHYGMTVEETWLGVTTHAAQALGRENIGRLVIGAQADIVIWDAERPSEIPYHCGRNLVHRVIKEGRLVAL